ncbi:MAG: hypothetical protein IH614_07555 [Desulfuromonadales bacterium]|nr:hypothetical protein [Desulfuromonadales bacterium]
MTSPNFENLVTTGQLKREPGDRREFDGLVRSARARLADARKHPLSIESRFDLAYNSAHALALAALRWHGYRSDNRYIVFQLLPLTLGLGPEVWRVLALCHQRRNRGEYEGFLEVDEQLVSDLVKAAVVLEGKVAEMSPLP